MSKYLYIWGLSLLLSTGMTFAQQKIWKTHTSMNVIQDIAISGNEIWCATSGGIFELNRIDDQFQQFTNIDGLSSIDIQTIEIDSDGDIWIGLYSGIINLFHKRTAYFEPIYDYERHIIHDLIAIGDSILVAFDDGMSLYVKSAREVKESYYSLGSFEDRIAVNKLFLDGLEIWAATNSGIAKSSLEMINLKDPTSWTNYTTSHGLPSNTIRSIAKATDHIYAATDKGIARLEGEIWNSINTGLSSIDVYSLFENQDILYAGTQDGVYKLTSDDSWSLVGDRVSFAVVLAADESGTIWVGKNKGTDKGLCYFNPDSMAWQTVVPPGPASNKFVDVVVDRNNLIWCACGDAGVQYFNGTKWTTLAFQTQQIRSGFVTAVVDPQNRKWFGSLGGGITFLDKNAQITTFGEGYLSDSDPNYFIVNDLDIDSKGNIWIINRLAATGNPLAVVTPDFEWQYFAQSSDGINTNLVLGIEIDRYDRIWVSTDDKGITVLDPGDTPLNKSDDQIAGHLTMADGLYSNKVQAMVEDLEGIIWIGTNKGLNRWYSIGGESHIDSVYELISNEITALEVDAQNNIWVGTTEGISMIPGNDRYERIEYSTEQSPLVSDIINSITFNGSTGDIFIGTVNGLSVIGTGFTAATTENYDSLQVYPNPFRIGSNSDLTIKNLAYNTKAVQIMTVNGVLVRNIPADNPLQGGYGGHVIWNGLNDKHELVASGIYVIVAHTEDGRKDISKVAVIRE